MSVWHRLMDWFFGPDEDEGEAEAPAPPARARSPRPPLPDDDDDDDDLLTPEVDRALAARYGEAPAEARDAPAGGLVTRILRYDVPEPAHRVWVSRGLRAWRRPHELVVRIRADGDGPTPEWPAALILALDARTRERDRTTALGEIVRDLEVAGAPYRHFLIVPDPVLEWIEDPFSADEGLAFVQVVPLSEERLAGMGDEEARKAALAAWSQEDHLLLV